MDSAFVRTSDTWGPFDVVRVAAVWTLVWG